MALQSIGLGTTEGDGTGDSIRDGGDKINDNFSEIYTLLGTGTALSSGISATATVVTLAAPSITGVASFADGSASAPSITNTGDANTGIFFSAADTVAVTTGGTLRISVDSNGLSATGDIKASDGVVSGKREIISTFNTSSAVTGSLTRAQSGGILLIDGTEDNVINLPAAATANVGTFYDYIVLTIGASDKTTIFNIAGSGGNFFGTLSLSGGTAANAVIDNAGDALTLVNSTVVGSRGRITCLVDNGTNGTWQVESVGSPIATIA